METYELIYNNEKEFKKLEKSLKKYNMLAYKKISFEYYPKLRSGEFEGELVSKKDGSLSYELKLPTDNKFAQIHGYVTLEYSVDSNDNKVILKNIKPRELLLEGSRKELTTYRGVMISKRNAAKDKFKIDLLEGIKHKDDKVCNYYVNNNYYINEEEDKSDNIKFNKLIPELSVTDIENSIDFYTSIGFNIIYEREEDKFCFVELEGNQIMLEEINDNWNTGKLEYPFGRGINISMTVEDVEGLYEDIIKLEYEIFKELKINEYKVRNKVYYDKEFLIQDPDGYLLRFSE